MQVWFFPYPTAVLTLATRTAALPPHSSAQHLLSVAAARYVYIPIQNTPYSRHSCSYRELSTLYIKKEIVGILHHPSLFYHPFENPPQLRWLLVLCWQMWPRATWLTEDYIPEDQGFHPQDQGGIARLGESSMRSIKLIQTKLFSHWHNLGAHHSYFFLSDFSCLQVSVFLLQFCTILSILPSRYNAALGKSV